MHVSVHEKTRLNLYLTSFATTLMGHQLGRRGVKVRSRSRLSRRGYGFGIVAQNGRCTYRGGYFE